MPYFTSLTSCSFTRKVFRLTCINNIVINIYSLHMCYSDDTHYDCLLVACIRRLQSWSLTSILSEYRQFCGSKRYFDIEQFIECFQPTSIELSPETTPDFLSLHLYMMVNLHSYYALSFLCYVLIHTYDVCVGRRREVIH